MKYIPLSSSDTSLMMALFDIGYVLSPVIGFIPQIYTRHITYDSFLSILTIVANILKIFANFKLGAGIVLTYQFFVCAALHCMLIKIRLDDIKGSPPPEPPLPLTSVLMRAKHSSKMLVSAAASLIILLRLLDTLGASSVFMAAAVGIEIVIAVLHIKYYTKEKNKPRELFIVWLLGDLLRMYLMFRRYPSPLISYLGVGAQAAVNVYIAVR